MNPNNYDYQSIPAGYYDLIFKKKGGIQRLWHFQKFKFISTFLHNAETHLDIGCGPGTFLGNFSKAKYSLGIDIASDQIEYARLHYTVKGVNFEVYDGGRLPSNDEFFDLITIIEVIEHLPNEDVNRLLDEAMRVLRPGGRLMITTPNYNSLWPLLEILVNKVAKISYEEQHINKYTNKKLRNLFLKRHARIVRCGSFMFSSSFLSPVGAWLSNIIFNIECRLNFLNFQLLSFIVIEKIRK